MENNKKKKIDENSEKQCYIDKGDSNVILNQTNFNKSEEMIKHKIVSLNYILSFVKIYFYYLIGAFVLFTTIFLYQGYIYSFLFGIFFTLICQSILFFFILGFGISDDKSNEVNKSIEIANEIKLVEEENISAEERNNDLKIYYKTINKKNLSNLDKSKKNEMSLSLLNSPESNEKSVPKIININEEKSNKSEKPEIDLNYLNLDPGYYCFCKFMPENFEKLIKMQNDIINNYSDSTVFYNIFN